MKVTRLSFLIIGAFACACAPLSLAQSVHLVKEGESLWLIAKRAGVSVDAIREANELKNDVIWEGAKLIIPAQQVPTRPSVQPAPPLRKITPEPEKRKGPKTPLSEKGMKILQLQVMLDRAGYSPGIIDGYEGKYTRLAKTLCEAWNPDALRTLLPATRVAQVPDSWHSYVDPNLPGSGSSPDFKALTQQPRVIRYYSGLEYLAERFHCSDGLLKKLNPQTDFTNLKAGSKLIVPNVIPFELERYFDSQGKGIWSSGLGKGSTDRTVYISASDMMLTIWDGAQLVRSYPITLNEDDSPRGRRELGAITPAPHYMRKKTKLELLPGPNSPVGIVWCPLGNGFGIHGTSNPATIGRASSSGCVRLANWDAVRFAKMIRKGATVVISQKDQQYTPKN